jgi:hypothetical protein
MIFTVCHAKEPTFGFGISPKFPAGYKPVAEIESPNLGETFRITNHIDSNWEKNPEVVRLMEKGNRSTSVGDVMLENDGTAHRCEMSGWSVIEWDDIT